MYYRVTLQDGTHFRMSSATDQRGTRVSFDQDDRETAWPFYPMPPNWTGSDADRARYIAQDSASRGGCMDVALIEPEGTI